MNSNALHIEAGLNEATIPENIREIGRHILSGRRLSVNEAITLYEHAELGLLGMLAGFVSQRLNGDLVLFNRNFHIEPTNYCIYNCSFCSYKRLPGQEGSWEYNLQQIKELAQSFRESCVTEVHITGGVHPKWTIDYLGRIILTIKKILPDIHVKAYSAVELDYVFSKARIKPSAGLSLLKEYGLDSIPGGGAEISDSEVRDKICFGKPPWSRWLDIHRAAHRVGLKSNATMLYGHFESYAHRVNHMLDLRALQDETGGFSCFIPLKFRSPGNTMEYLGEVDVEEDLRNFAVSRLFLDNIKHLKAYWPMLGKPTTKLALSFGVDDVDGTISDTTRIYSMAGVQEQSITVEGLCSLIRSAGKQPAERDSLYNIIRTY